MAVQTITATQLQRYGQALRSGKQYNRTQAINRLVVDGKLTWFDASNILDQCVKSAYILQEGKYYKRDAADQ